jgi:hypothetical protein
VNGGRTVGGGDAGRHPKAALRVDAHGERGGKLFRVPLGHLGEPQLITSLAGERQADQSTPVQRHEVDHLGRSQLGSAHEITLVLTIFVVGHDNDLAIAEIIDRLIDRTEGGHT